MSSKGKTRSKGKINPKDKRWIQQAGLKKGTMRVYVKNRYGSKGFNKDGTLKISVLQEIADDPAVHSKTRKRAVLAINLKKISRKKTGV